MTILAGIARRSYRDDAIDTQKEWGASEFEQSGVNARQCHRLRRPARHIKQSVPVSQVASASAATARSAAAGRSINTPSTSPSSRLASAQRSWPIQPTPAPAEVTCEIDQFVRLARDEGGLSGGRQNRHSIADLLAEFSAEPGRRFDADRAVEGIEHRRFEFEHGGGGAGSSRSSRQEFRWTIWRPSPTNHPGGSASPEKSFIPASRQRCLSSKNAFAVRATTGIWRMRSSKRRIARVASTPSISGISISISTTSKCFFGPRRWLVVRSRPHVPNGPPV